MNMRRILLGFAVGFALSVVPGLAAGVALAGQNDGTPPPPFMFHMQEPSGICADAQYVYVMAGRKILQYGITNLKVVKTVELPEPPPPPEAPPRETARGKFPPPPPPAMPHGLWTGNGVLYVLAGPEIHRYSTPDLILQTSVELPAPEPPETGN